MKILLRCFAEICLLRAGPQYLPASTFLLAAALTVYGFAGLFLSLVNTTFFGALLMVMVDILLLIAFAYVILRVRVMTARFVQTLTALAGTGAILEFVAWPALVWQQLSATADGGGVMIPSLLLWVWLFWSIAVVGHILRHALSTTFTAGALLSLLYTFISIGVVRALFFLSPA